MVLRVLGVFGHRELDVHGVTGMCADEALVELGRHDAVAHLVEVLLDLQVLGALPVDGPGEREQDEIERVDAAVLDDLQARIAVTQVLDLGIDLGVRRRVDRHRDLEILDRGELHLGTHRDLGREGVVLVLHQGHMLVRLHSKCDEALVLDGDRATGLDERLTRLPEHLVAPDLGVDDGARGFAGPEARQLGVARDGGVHLRDEVVHLAGGPSHRQADQIVFELLDAAFQVSS